MEVRDFFRSGLHKRTRENPLRITQGQAGLDMKAGTGAQRQQNSKAEQQSNLSLPCYSLPLHLSQYEIQHSGPLEIIPDHEMKFLQIDYNLTTI